MVALGTEQNSRRAGAVREIVMLALLYGGYSVVRSLADSSLGRATASATRIVDLERAIGLDLEAGANELVASTPWLAVPSSFWYASLHFVVTGGVLVWLFLRRPHEYSWARSTLVAATACALVLYLLVPTAPPRLAGDPYRDVLAETSWAGWWPESGHGAAPTGIGNELAAFPSMHAGWALWVAMVCWSTANRHLVRLGCAYAIITAAVVVGTGNHWTLDVLAGWALVGLAAVVVRVAAGRRSDRTAHEQSTRTQPRGQLAGTGVTPAVRELS